jgi:hypothetical protein
METVLRWFRKSVTSWAWNILSDTALIHRFCFERSTWQSKNPTASRNFFTQSAHQNRLLRKSTWDLKEKERGEFVHVIPPIFYKTSTMFFTGVSNKRVLSAYSVKNPGVLIGVFTMSPPQVRSRIGAQGTRIPSKTLS